MTLDYGQIFPQMPRQVTLADITVRDGLQHEERFISTKAKCYYLEQLVFAGLRNLEITNLGNTYLMPQFRDGKELLAYVRGERFLKKCQKRGINPQDITWTAITIREKAVDAAIELKKQGLGPDRLLMMVSTEEQHHYINSGTTLPEYWKEAERCIQKAHDAGMTMCGTVSTIWGGPILGKTKLEDAFSFTKRWLDIGADTIEHADHDGSASAPDVYRYFAEVLERFPDPKVHIAHFHETKRLGSANVLAALQAGISHFEATLGGIGGMPANFVDDCPCGIGEYYFEDPREVGLICLEDTLIQLDEMGISHGLDVERILALGRQMEKTLGRRLRSGAVIHGRTAKNGHPQFARAELPLRKQQLGEASNQMFPREETVD